MTADPTHTLFGEPAPAAKRAGIRVKQAVVPSPPSPSGYFDPDGPSAPVAWYGGKAYYAKWIIEHFPPHRVFVEPFGGAANVLLRKRPSEVEIYNDLDGRIVNFFRVLRDRGLFEEFERLVTLTPYSREEYRGLVDEPEPQDPVQRAWWFFVRARQTVGGLGMSKLSPNGWAMSTRTRRHMAEPVSKYLSAIDGLEAVAQRFRTVAIESLPALDLIRKYNAPDVLLYCDPPYMPQTRFGSKAKTYGKEMVEEDHAALLQALKGFEGKVILSGYPCELYDEVLKGWSKQTLEVKAQMANSGQTRLEVLWMNY